MRSLKTVPLISNGADYSKVLSNKLELVSIHLPHVVTGSGLQDCPEEIQACLKEMGP